MMKKKKEKTKREKGLEFQRWIRKWLIDHGWECVNIPPRGILIKDKKTGQMRYISLHNDIFGCDLIARKILEKDGFEYVQEIWIQATLDDHVTRKIEEINRFPFMRTDYVETQIWMKVKPGLVNIKKINFIPDQALLDQASQENTGSGLRGEDLGKIIKGKFYSAEGRKYEF